MPRHAYLVPHRLMFASNRLTKWQHSTMDQVSIDRRRCESGIPMALVKACLLIKPNSWWNLKAQRQSSVDMSLPPLALFRVRVVIPLTSPNCILCTVTWLFPEPEGQMQDWNVICSKLKLQILHVAVRILSLHPHFTYRSHLIFILSLFPSWTDELGHSDKWRIKSNFILN